MIPSYVLIIYFKKTKIIDYLILASVFILIIISTFSHIILIAFVHNLFWHLMSSIFEPLAFFLLFLQTSRLRWSRPPFYMLIPLILWFIFLETSIFLFYSGFNPVLINFSILIENGFRIVVLIFLIQTYLTASKELLTDSTKTGRSLVLTSFFIFLISFTLNIFKNYNILSDNYFITEILLVLALSIMAINFIKFPETILMSPIQYKLNQSPKILKLVEYIITLEFVLTLAPSG